MTSFCLNKYQEKWETRSSIRTRPRKLIDFQLSGDFYPRHKQLLFILPEVYSLDETQKSEILIKTFYKYLSDIIDLEVNWICLACDKIIRGNLMVPYSEAFKMNAYTIIMDEYYHMYMAYDMILQLKEQFPDINFQTFSTFSDSHHAIITIKNKLNKKYWDMFEILVVSIFETTLVRELVEYFQGPDIHPSIQYYVNDHMNDESKHYSFFFEILCYTWENLTDDYKENIGKYLAEFIHLYLNINGEKAYNFHLLSSILHSEEKAAKRIDSLYKNFCISPELPLVKNVLMVLQKSKILESNYVKSGFQALQLV